MSAVFVPPPLAKEPLPQEELLYGSEFGKQVKPVSGNAHDHAAQFLSKLKKAAEHKDVSQFMDLFIDNDAAAWRDLLGLQWDIRSFYGHQQIKKLLINHLDEAELKNIELSDEIEPTVVKPFDGLEWVQVLFTFKVKSGTGKGLARLVNPGSNDLKVFTLTTMLDQIDGHEERINSRRPRGVNHGNHANRKSYLERRTEETAYANHSPQVLICGGGQAGLTLAARLKTMGVDCLIVEKNPRLGDNWRNRYKFLVLHDQVWYDHMPYVQFPPTWPVYTPKDKLADFFESYAKILDLNVWTGSMVQGGEYDDDKSQWSVQVRKEDGSIVTLKPNHVVQATGHSGEPNIPKLPGMEKFKGRLVHSSQHGTGADWKGKTAVVVGCCNSALDIAHDFYEQGAQVTVYQRSSTCVISADGGNNISNKGVYCEGGPPADTGDWMSHSMPNKVKLAVDRNVARKIADNDQEILNGLKKVGFNLDYGYGGSGHWSKYLIRGGGYYLDVGAAPLLIDGSIKLKQGGEVADFTEDGIKFSDGAHLKADIIVLATGYQNMRSTARKMFGDKVADRLGDAWGLNAEHELKHMWTSSGHPGYWYMGGNLALCRFYSKRLALRIAAEEAGLV